MTLQEKEDRVAWLHANNVNVGTLDDFGLLIWDAVRRMTPEQKKRNAGGLDGQNAEKRNKTSQKRHLTVRV